MKTAKRLVVIITLGLIVCWCAAPTLAEQTQPQKATYRGDKGEFKYPDPADSGYGTEFEVYNSGAGGGSGGLVGGVVDQKTKISVLNKPGITLENLDLLSGKQVIVIAKCANHGEGEGSYTTCSELTILLMPMDSE